LLKDCSKFEKYMNIALTHMHYMHAKWMHT
jgi:hypothetical protein